jgi:hypothetical protein
VGGIVVSAAALFIAQFAFWAHPIDARPLVAAVLVLGHWCSSSIALGRSLPRSASMILL